MNPLHLYAKSTCTQWSAFSESNWCSKARWFVIFVHLCVCSVLTMTKMCSRCMCSCRTRGGSRTVGWVTSDCCSELLMDTWKYSVPLSSHCCFQCTCEMSGPVPDISTRHRQNRGQLRAGFNCQKNHVTMYKKRKNNDGKNRPDKILMQVDCFWDCIWSHSVINTTGHKFGIIKDFSMVLKEVSFAHQVCTLFDNNNMCKSKI